MEKFNFKKMTPFKWFVLENFPFIEADFDALTEWQLFCKLGKEINKIIKSENELGTQVENVTNAFIELENYINNYFDNLDVQEEVNNKLNDMAESGELEEIISQYLELTTTYMFDTVDDMLASEHLIAGSRARTLGFYEKNDGGGALYTIREITNQDTPNTYSLMALDNSNTLVAELFTNNNEEIRITQLGIENNNKTILEYALENFKKVIIDQDITLTSGITIDNNCNVELLEGLGSIINCEENGINLTKNSMQFINLFLEGEYNTDSIGINLNSSYNYFENVMITHFGIGLNMSESGSWNNNFIHCNFNQNTNFGIYIISTSEFQHNDLHFDKCRLVGNGQNVLDNSNAEITKGDAIRIKGGINITITDCDIETNSNAGIYLSDNNYQLRNVKVENCYIENNKLTSIYYYKGSGPHKHIYLNNNFFNPTSRNIPNKLA